MTIPTPIQLYRLVYAHPQAKQYSPHVWKTLLDLALLDISSESTDYTFTEIRTTLSEHTGNNAVTVPTIEYDSSHEPRFVTDSWTIALHLEEKYAAITGKSLFGGESGKSLAKFVEVWSNTELGGELRPLIVPGILAISNPENKQHLSKKIGGEAGLARLNNISDIPELLEKQLAGARAKLSLIESVLKEKAGRSSSLWLSGQGPSHADFALFGWYAFSSINPALIEGVWKHKDLPHVAKWVETVLSSGLVDKALLA